MLKLYQIVMACAAIVLGALCIRQRPSPPPPGANCRMNGAASGLPRRSVTAAVTVKVNAMSRRSESGVSVTVASATASCAETPPTNTDCAVTVDGATGSEKRMVMRFAARS